MIQHFFPPYLSLHTPAQLLLPQGFLILISSTCSPVVVVTFVHSITLMAWNWPSSGTPMEELWTQQLMAHRSFSSSESWDRRVLLAVCWVWVSLDCCDDDSAPFRLHRTTIVPLKSTIASHTWPAHKRSYEPCSLAYAFSKSATQNALGLWHREKQRVSLIQGSWSSTRTSIQCPFRQNRNRNSPW